MSAGLQFIKGEMAEWSEHMGPPPAGGPVLRRLVEQHLRRDAHVLVVGFHDDVLLDLVVSRSRSVVLVLRSRPDAVEAADRFGDEVLVVCGDAGALELAEPAEVLVALDGLGRTVSAEVEAVPWRERWMRLVTHLAPGAQVMLGTPNPLGLPELGGIVPELSDTDADWRPAVPTDPSAPSGPQALGALLPGAVTWSLFPDHRWPGVAAPVGTTVPGSGTAALVRLHAGAGPGHLDAPTTMQAAVAVDRADELAGGWAAITESDAAARLVCDLIAPPPDGYVLEEAFLSRIAAREIGDVRALTARVAELVRALPPDQLTRLTATDPAEVLITDTDDLVPLVPDGTGTSDAGADLILARWFWAISNRLGQLGWRHPFPDVAGRREVAQLLAACARVPSDAVEAVLAAANHNPLHHVPDPEVGRLQRENDALRAKIAWFEAAVRHRETLLAELRRKRTDPRPRLQRELEQAVADLEALRGSRTYRIGRLGTGPARVVRRLRRR